MNYVGQLAGQVFVQVKELYRGLNPATLSGCIDVIVVRQPDGSLLCSPFHVRFGKMGVLRSREKVVDMEINGEPVDLHMKLGDNGEAFFVQETENDQEVVPSYLATSPILSEGAALMSSSLMGKSSGPPIQTLGSTGSNGETGSGMIKKRRKRRRKARVDSVRREESADYSENEDMFTIDISSDEGTDMENSRSSSRDVLREETVGSISSAFKQSGIYTRSDGEWSPIQSPGNSRPTSPKSDSELITKATNADNQNPAMHWAWGELPQAATVTKLPIHANKHRELSPVSIPVSENTHFRVITHETSSEQCGASCDISALGLVMSEEAAVTEETLFPGGMESESTRMEAQTVTSEAQAAAAGSVVTRMMTDVEETMLRPPGKTDSPSKRKDKRSRHLGSDGIYLDDITELEPEVAALYFPKSGAAVRSISDPGLHCTSISPQSVSSGGDSGVDSYCDHMTDLPSIAISLCGGLTDNREITKGKCVFAAFMDLILIYFVVSLRYYNWSTAAPIMLAMQAFQKPLPKAAVDNIMKEKMPKKGGRWWFSWRGRNSKESSSSDEDHRADSQNSPTIQSEPGLTSGGVSYKKTLRLTSEQLLSLQLQDGPNDVVFSVTTQYQGTCRCQGTIYLWNWDDKIIISDIDGTITRSDTLGHILPTLGKDWTHQGIAQLYHKVSQNGYKFLYCSARAIGMADMTRGYLNWVNERGTMLPMGPVLLSPSSLFSALHRSVIEKKPEKFKVECLNDIKNLFYPNTQPFYAAFGNRPTDVYSYKEVGVPLNRIFTVNPKGELVQEHAKTNISSYVRLGEVVDHVFPLKARASSSDFPCSDTYSHFTYWREQLPQVDHQETTPPPTPSPSN
uniref:phosphatidate phosphatase n=1 Tax=Mastacembelus armatus TaxID=205130 RepID=A0A7N8WLJ7_9TELE